MNSSPNRNDQRSHPRNTSQPASTIPSNQLSNSPIVGAQPPSRSQNRQLVIPSHATTNTPRRNVVSSTRVTPNQSRTSPLQSHQTRVPSPPRRNIGRNSHVQNASPLYELPRSILPSIFGDRTGALSKLMSVISDLRAVQQMVNGRHKFHLFVESEQGELSSQNSGRFEHVVTRVIFSPTISLQHMNNDEQVHALVRMLNGISWEGTGEDPLRAFSNSARLNMRDASARRSVAATTVTMGDVEARHQTINDNSFMGGDTREIEPDIRIDSSNMAYPNAPLRSDLVLSIHRRALPDSSVANWYASHRNELEFPAWFPFQAKEYTSGPQVTGEPLYIRKEAIENFEFHENLQIQWIYRELFEFLFREAKRKKIRGAPSVFKYACFTPPWFRSQIIKGEEGDFANQTSSYFTHVVVPDMRNQRSRMGAKRLSCILGAFLQYEPSMTRKAMIHLLRVVPLNPTLQKSKPRQRVGYMLPLASRTPRNIEVQQPIHLGTNQAPSSAQHRQSTRRPRDEPVCSEAQRSPPNESERNVRRRIEFANGLGTDNELEGRQRVEGNVQTQMVARRRLLPLFASENSEEDSEEHETGANELSDSSKDDQEKEPFGDDEEMDRSAIQANATSSQQEAIVSVPVVCAFGQQCRFLGVYVMQNEAVILGKCRVCFRRIHDLCKGGEDGDSVCPTCKERQDDTDGGDTQAR